jgi:hypothetical protein
MEKLKTPELARKLAREIAPTGAAPSPAAFLAGWFGGAAFLAAFALAVMRLRPGFALAVTGLEFWLETSLWLSSGAMSALAVYRLSIPSMRTAPCEQGAILLLSALLLSIAFRASPGGSIAAELDWYRGRCGPIIIGLGAIYSVALFAWLKHAAPTRPTRSGAWAAVSAGLAGSFVLQFVCEHAEPAHLLLWHVTPVILLGTLGAWLGRKALSW